MEQPVLEEGPSGSPSRCSKFDFQAYRPDASPRSPGPGELRGFSTPRRFLLHLRGLPANFWRVGGSDAELGAKRSTVDRDLLEGCLRQGLLADVFLCRHAASIFLGPVLGKMLAKFAIAGFRVVSVGELRP